MTQADKLRLLAEKIDEADAIVIGGGSGALERCWL